MGQVKWINVLELFIAGILIALFWAFLEGPCRRIAHLLHGLNYEGRKIHKDHEEHSDYSDAA